MNHSVTIREKLVQYGFSSDGLRDEAQKARQCRHCKHPQVEDALDLPILPETYGTGCSLFYGIPESAGFKAAWALASALSSIEKATKERDLDSLKRADQGETFRGNIKRANLKHSSGNDVKSVIEGLILKALREIYGEPRALGGNLLVQVSFMEDAVRRGNWAEYGWGGRRVFIVNKESASFYKGIKCEILKDTDTIETLEMTDVFLESTLDLKTAIEAARTV